LALAWWLNGVSGGYLSKMLVNAPKSINLQWIFRLPYIIHFWQTWEQFGSFVISNKSSTSNQYPWLKLSFKTSTPGELFTPGPKRF
jgi:hypothetical protein